MSKNLPNKPKPEDSPPPLNIGREHFHIQANQGPPGHYRKSIDESKGFGDTVSKLIKKATGGKAKECEPCKKRKEKLNKMFPYKNNDDKN